MMMRRNRCIVSIVHPTILLLLCLLLYTIVVLVVVIPIEATEIKWIPNMDTDRKQETRKKDRSAENAPKSQKYWNDNNIQRPDYGKTDNEIAFERRQQMGGNTITLPKWLVGFIISAIFGIVAAKYLYVNQNKLMNNISNFTSLSSFGNNNTTSTTTTNSTTTNSNHDEKMRLARLTKFTTDTTTLASIIKID